MHKTTGQRDPAVAFPLRSTRDDAQDRRQANKAIAVSAIGLAATGLVELLLALLTGSVGLLGDAIHNLSDVSTSAVVFLGSGCPGGRRRNGTPMVWNEPRTWPASASPW
jgi:Co/Zn/Cd efflux system component